jgi:hypothetical protein
MKGKVGESEILGVSAFKANSLAWAPIRVKHEQGHGTCANGVQRLYF